MVRCCVARTRAQRQGKRGLTRAVDNAVRGGPGAPDPDRVTTVTAIDKKGNSIELSYSSAKIIGNGSFGVVFQAKVVSTGEAIAIKKVLQDKRFKVRVPSRRFILDEVTFSSCRIASCSSCDR